MKDYATLTVGLMDLTRKNMPNLVIWTEEHQQAFDTLKQCLITGPILQGPDHTKEYFLQTDASNRGVGAVLSQKDAQGGDRPVAYYSKKLLLRETRYSSIEKECLEIVKGVCGVPDGKTIHH